MALPEWPKETPTVRLSVGSCVPTVSEQYYRALAEAYAARLHVAVEALNCLYPGLALDLRYETDPDAIDAYRSRVNTVEDAVRAIGELPEEST